MSSFVPSRQVELIVAAAVGQAVACLNESIFGLGDHNRGTRGSPRPRKRRSIHDIFECIGPTYFRRAYRMTFESFLLLHDKIGNLIEYFAKQHIYLGRKKKRSGRQVRRGIVPPPPPNGSIVSSTRLGCALRYFAGGDSTDIMVNYGIGYTDVLVSVWSNDGGRLAAAVAWWRLFGGGGSAAVAAWRGSGGGGSSLAAAR